MSDLNAEQTEALPPGDGGPCCILLQACPGSGKTRTLAFAAAKELRLASKTNRIFAITYTRRAAEEIEERIEGLGVDSSFLWVGTIHAFCLEWILRPYSVYLDEISAGFEVLDPYVAEQYLKDEARAVGGITVRDCGHYFTEQGVFLTTTDSRRRARVADAVDRYHKRLRLERKMDFEMVLFYAYRLIATCTAVSKLLSNMIGSLLLDEYQDTKAIQYRIVCAIVRANNRRIRLFIVGDPNQSIYGGFGGYPISKHALADATGLNVVAKTLTKNYRSSERIIEFYRHFRITEEPIVASGPNNRYPSIVSYNTTVPVAELACEIRRLINSSLDLGIAAADICVLGPQWPMIGKIARELYATTPPLQYDGPNITPFSRNPDNFWFRLAQIALTRPSPRNYFRRRSWAREIHASIEAYVGAKLKLSPNSLLRISNSIKLDTSDGLTFLREFFKIFCVEIRVPLMEIPALRAEIDGFFASAAERILRLEKEGAGFVTHVDHFRRAFGDKGGITVSSLHAVKGDEFDTVIAFGLLEGIVPHFGDADKRNSSRKLLYVCCSRARKNLHLISERRSKPWDESQLYSATCELEHLRFDYDV